MIELLRQHATRTGKSYKEMQGIYHELKAQAKLKNLSNQKETVFLMESLAALPDKEGTSIKEIVVESKPEVKEVEAVPVVGVELPSEDMQKKGKGKDK